jgi:hypothetical protein
LAIRTNISNGPYEMGDVAGLGRRARLDAGTLGVVAVRVDSARQAIGLLRRGHGQGLTVLTAGEVTIDADAAEIPVGIDGETVMLPTPDRCVIRPRALRVVVPRERPGVPAPKPALEWPRLRQLAQPWAATPSLVVRSSSAGMLTISIPAARGPAARDVRPGHGPDRPPASGPPGLTGRLAAR